jgi:uncharacterized protein YydD (DUF2326 family)
MSAHDMEKLSINDEANDESDYSEEEYLEGLPEDVLSADELEEVFEDCVTEFPESKKKWLDNAKAFYKSLNPANSFEDETIKECLQFINSKY